jgi:hypothetical protein
MYEFTPPPPNDNEQAQLPLYVEGWEEITLSLPGDTTLGLPSGHWERHNGRIEATYERHELTLAVAVTLGTKRAALEARLETGLAVLSEAHVSDADRLITHWLELNAEYDRVTSRLRAVEAEL